MVFRNICVLVALGESSLSIGRVKSCQAMYAPDSNGLKMSMTIYGLTHLHSEFLWEVSSATFILLILT